MAGELISRGDSKEWTRLADNLADCFADPLGISRAQYLDTLPSFTPEPETYVVKFDTLVLVQPPNLEKGLTPEKILEIIGLPYNHPYFEDWKGARFRTPSVPYATWLNDGSRDLLRSARYLSNDTRPGTAFDGAFLYFADKGLGISRSHYPYLPGSGGDDSHSAYMCRWSEGQWALDSGWFGDPGYGVVTAGRQIVIRNPQQQA